MDRHPGGREQILLAAGMDISAIFDSYQSKQSLQVMGVCTSGDRTKK